MFTLLNISSSKLPDNYPAFTDTPAISTNLTFKEASKTDIIILLSIVLSKDLLTRLLTIYYIIYSSIPGISYRNISY